MPREFKPIYRNIRGYLRDPRVVEFVNTAANAVAKQAEGMVGSVNGQPAPYLVHRPAPFERDGSKSGNEIGPPRFYRQSRTGKKRHRATVTYSHPTPQGRMRMRQALMVAAHTHLHDVVDGEVMAAEKKKKRWERRNAKLAKMSVADLQARADKKAARKAAAKTKRREAAAKRKADPEYQARMKARRAAAAVKRKRSNAAKRGWETRRGKAD